MMDDPMIDKVWVIAYEEWDTYQLRVVFDNKKDAEEYLKRELNGQLFLYEMRLNVVYNNDQAMANRRMRS